MYLQAAECVLPSSFQRSQGTDILEPYLLLAQALEARCRSSCSLSLYRATAETCFVFQAHPQRQHVPLHRPSLRRRTLVRSRRLHARERLPLLPPRIAETSCAHSVRALTWRRDGFRDGGGLGGGQAQGGGGRVGSESVRVRAYESWFVGRHRQGTSFISSRPQFEPSTHLPDKTSCSSFLARA